MKQSLSGRILAQAICGKPAPKTGEKEFDPLLLLKSGSNDAFSQLYNANIQRLSFYAYRFVGRHEVAEDLAHETLAKVWEERTRFSSFAHLHAFMFVTARNACITWIRSHHTQLKTAEIFTQMIDEKELQPAIDWEKIHTDLIGRIYQLIDELPDSGSRIIRASLLDGLSHEQIAQELDITPNSVAVKKFRAITALRSMLRRSGLMS